MAAGEAAMVLIYELASGRRLMLALPIHELAKQRVALLRVEAGAPVCRKEAREIGAVRLRVCRRLCCRLRRELVEHLARDAEPRPPGDRGSEVDVAPFRMPRRLAELVPVVEQRLNEPLDPHIAVGALLPVEYRKHGRD